MTFKYWVFLQEHRPYKNLGKNKVQKCPPQHQKFKNSYKAQYYLLGTKLSHQKL